MHAVLIVNPVAGLSALATPQVEGTPASHEEIILTHLRTCGIEPEVHYTTPEDTGRGLATQAADNGTELVIAAGGDGTIHAVASGLIGRKSTLGIISLGTMNNLARSLGIPETIKEACAAIVNGETRAVDVGTINGKHFLEVAGVGIEAALFPSAEEFKSPGFFSMVRGVIGGLYTLLTFKPTKLKISFDDRQHRSYEAIQVTICNSPFYGAHLQIAPDVLMDDGLLDVVVYRRFSKLEYIRHAVSISQGRRVFEPKIMHRRVKSLRVHSHPPVEVQVDGIPHDFTPITAGVEQGALRIRVPLAALTDAPGLKDEPEAEKQPQPLIKEYS